MKKILNFILFFLVMALAVTMIGDYLYNNKRTHEYKNNVIEDAESKRTISKELYCMTKDAVEFKIEITHAANLNNPHQMYTDIQRYFFDVEYKDLKNEFIKLYPHLINIYKDEATKLQSIHLYETDNKTYIKFKYV